MSKRILSLVLAMVMVLGTFGTMVFAETGSEKIDWLVEQGMVQGNESGDLMLEALIDRASTARMIAVALELEAEAAGLKGLASGFKDMTPAHWANGYANLAAGKNLIVGDENGNFMPGKDITYGEVAAILVRLKLGRDLTAEERGAAGSWVAPYVAKASEEGILDDVSVVSFEAKAVRKDVLEMFYNAMINMEVGNYTVVKAIVLENDRVERIGENEVVVELIRILQKSDFADESRAEAGDQLKFAIDEKVGDVENLLGKVADFTLNKEGEVVKIAVDNSYDYLQGSFTVASRRFGRYTVELPERYRTSDERIFRTYSNNEAYSYEDFAKEVSSVEFARVTVKNGKVLFIDAFNFDDVAPVAKDIDSRNRVAYYDDNKNGDLSTLTLGANDKVLVYEDGSIKVGSKDDIVANDVIHFFTVSRVNTVVVRPVADNIVEGEYTRSHAGRATHDTDIVIEIDDEGYPADVDTAKRKPVFSRYMSEYDFEVLTGAYRKELEDFLDTDVIVLRDLFGKVQLIASETIDGSFYAIVTNTSRRSAEMRLYREDNEHIWYETDRTTMFSSTGESTKDKQFDAFGRLDLVSARSTEDEFLTHATLLTEEAYAVNKINRNLIELAEVGTRYINNSTIIFVTSGTTPQAMTISQFLDKYNTTGLTGYVVEHTRGDLDLARVIVLETATAKAASTNNFVAKVDRVRMMGDDYELKLVTADDEVSYHLVTGAAYADMITNNDVMEDVIIKAYVTKTDDEYLQKLEVLLDGSSTLYTVLDKATNRIQLSDNVWYRFDANASIFVDYIEIGDYVSVVIGDDGLITVLDGRDEPSVTPSSLVTYVNATGSAFEYKGKIYRTNDDTVIKTAAGNTVGIGVADVKANLIANTTELNATPTVVNGYVTLIVIK